MTAGVKEPWDWLSMLRQKWFSIYNRNMRLFECAPPTEVIFSIFFFSFFSSFAAFWRPKSQSFEFSAALLSFSCSLSLARCLSLVYLSTCSMFMARLSNGQIILVLFTTASHITLCLRFQDIHFYRYVSFFFFSGIWLSSFVYFVMDMIVMYGQYWASERARERISAGIQHSKSVWLWASEKNWHIAIFALTFTSHHVMQSIPFHCIAFTSYNENSTFGYKIAPHTYSPLWLCRFKYISINMFCDRRPNNEIIFLIAYSNFSIESVRLYAILLTKPIYQKRWWWWGWWQW